MPPDRRKLSLLERMHPPTPAPSKLSTSSSGIIEGPSRKRQRYLPYNTTSPLSLNVGSDLSMKFSPPMSQCWTRSTALTETPGSGGSHTSLLQRLPLASRIGPKLESISPMSPVRPIEETGQPLPLICRMTTKRHRPKNHAQLLISATSLGEQ